MSFEQLIKAETGLPDKYVEMLMHYMRFLQSEYQKEQVRETASSALGKEWMTEDFDVPLDDPWVPVRPLIGAFPQDFMPDREQPAWDSVPDREKL